MYRVLIVEDEIIVRMWLKKQVKWEACGFEIVAEAGNGRDALELFRNNKIDLVLTDIRMPVMDGIELLQRIRQEDARVRFLILTCLDEFSLVKQAMALDVTNYILKLTSEPDEIERELLRVKQMLDREAEKTAPATNGAAAQSSDVLCKNQRLSAALTFLEKHYSEDISLALVADKVGVTPNYLGKIFYQHRGSTFTDELNKLRIQKAKQLLDDPAYRIYEIAEKTGFLNTTYFFRVFKKYEGCTPTEYRGKRNE